jgi:hypothetical protein
LLILHGFFNLQKVLVFYARLGHNNGILWRFVMKNMWADFSDFSLVMLAMRYGIADKVEFDARGLLNREQVEELLSDFELEMAFGDK